MPMYNFRCNACGKETAKIFADLAKAKTWEGQCSQEACGGKFVRAPRAATSRITETLDNGVMARRLERPADAERLFYEHTHRKSE